MLKPLSVKNLSKKLILAHSLKSTIKACLFEELRSSFCRLFSKEVLLATRAHLRLSRQSLETVYVTLQKKLWCFVSKFLPA